jgi:hypothetical protein
MHGDQANFLVKNCKHCLSTGNMATLETVATEIGLYDFGRYFFGRHIGLLRSSQLVGRSMAFSVGVSDPCGAISIRSWLRKRRLFAPLLAVEFEDDFLF